MFLQYNVVLYPKGFLLRFPRHGFPTVFGLLFRLFLPEFLLGTSDLRRFTLVRRRGIFCFFFRFNW